MGGDPGDSERKEAADRRCRRDKIAVYLPVLVLVLSFAVVSASAANAGSSSNGEYLLLIPCVYLFYACGLFTFCSLISGTLLSVLCPLTDTYARDGKQMAC